MPLIRQQKMGQRNLAGNDCGDWREFARPPNDKAARGKLTEEAPEATIFMKRQLVRTNSGGIRRPFRNYNSLKVSELT